MGGIPWLILYLLDYFYSGLGFLLINVNSDQIADGMQRSGEYIENLYPGEATCRYIHKIVGYFAFVGALLPSFGGWSSNASILLDIRHKEVCMISVCLWFYWHGLFFLLKDEVDTFNI